MSDSPGAYLNVFTSLLLAICFGKYCSLWSSWRVWWVSIQPVRVLQPEGNVRGNWLPVSVSHSFYTSSVGGLIPTEEKPSCSFQEREKVYGRNVIGNKVELGITCLYVVTICLPIGNIYVLSAFSFNSRQRSEAPAGKKSMSSPNKKAKILLQFLHSCASNFSLSHPLLPGVWIKSYYDNREHSYFIHHLPPDPCSYE